MLIPRAEEDLVSGIPANTYKIPSILLPVQIQKQENNNQEKIR
jgi:hypothetical protein